MKNKWKLVKFASDLPICECCGETFCPQCNKHFFECDCIGPTQDEIEYKYIKGVLYGRIKNEKDN